MTLQKTAKPSVLLIGADPLKQQLRATAFRNCEINVHTAVTLSDAIKLCSASRYDLVLIATSQHGEEPMLIYDELRKVAPRQRIAVFVGPPRYLRELDAVQGGSKSQGTNLVPRLRIVHSQPQGPRWSALIKRLLPTG